MRNKPRLRYIWIAAFSLIPWISAAQTSTLPAFITDSLDTYISRALVNWNIPGVAVAIVKDNQVVMAKGYGVTETGGKQPVDASTLFMIASNVKAFTGTAMAMLEHDSLCSLSDKVTKWLPEFSLYDPGTTRQATLKDLLAHNLGYSTFQADWLCFYSTLTREDLFDAYPQAEPPYPYREKYGYSNFGYFFAGECIRAISGMPWDKYIRQKILDPLQMDRTQLLTGNLSQLPNTAKGHTFESGVLKKFPFPNVDVIGAAAGMSSSATDLSHWLMAQLNEGTYGGNKVIPNAVIAKTRTPVTIIGRNQHLYNSTHYELYGLGWSMEDYAGKEVVSHSGGIWGFVSCVALVPEAGLGIVVLTNSDENWFYEALKWEIIDAFLELPYRNYSDEYLRMFRQRADMKKLNDEGWANKVIKSYPHGLKASDFAGTWSNDLYGKMEITVVANGLKATFEHHPGMEALLVPMPDDTFLCTYTPTRWGTFRLKTEQDEAGRLFIDIRVADRLDRGTYRFGKIVAY